MEMPRCSGDSINSRDSSLNIPSLAALFWRRHHGLKTCEQDRMTLLPVCAQVRARLNENKTNSWDRFPVRKQDRDGMGTMFRCCRRRLFQQSVRKPRKRSMSMAMLLEDIVLQPRRPAHCFTCNTALWDGCGSLWPFMLS